MSTSLAPDQILREVAQMWTSLGKQDSARHGDTARAEAGVLRACSLTLVVIAAPGEDPASLGETLAALMPRHPARAIVIHLGGPKPPSVGVTAQCWMPFGQRRQICCEQIEITAAENALDDVASILGPIAAPDLPVILWCRGRAAIDAPAFHRLAALAARVIVDSAQWPDPQGAVRRLAELARHLHLGDLSWTRLTRWREMLSQVFENPKYADHIPEIARIKVTYGGAAAPVEAYYMAAWLSSALKRAGAQAALALAADPQAEAGHIQAVELSDDGFTLNLSRLRGNLITSVDSVSRCINLPPPADHLLMNEELDIVRADPVFEAVLVAAALLE
jgi:Glucose-6-phosphate dehydrogenase subunit